MIIRRRHVSGRSRRDSYTAMLGEQAKLVTLWCLRALLSSRYYHQWVRTPDEPRERRHWRPLLWAAGFEHPEELPDRVDALREVLQARLRQAEEELRESEVAVVQNTAVLARGRYTDEQGKVSDMEASIKDLISGDPTLSSRMESLLCRLG